MYLKVTNFTENIIRFDTGNSFVIPCPAGDGRKSIEVSFTAVQVGQYSVQIDLVHRVDFMEPHQFEAFMSNGFSDEYMDSVTQDEFNELEELAEKAQDKIKISD